MSQISSSPTCRPLNWSQSRSPMAHSLADTSSSSRTTSPGRRSSPSSALRKPLMSGAQSDTGLWGWGVCVTHTNFLPTDYGPVKGILMTRHLRFCSYLQRSFVSWKIRISLSQHCTMHDASCRCVCGIFSCLLLGINVRF